MGRPVAVVAVLVSVVALWGDYSGNVEERTVNAWQLLTTKAPGNSGKIEALEYLNREDGLLCATSLRGRLRWLHGDSDAACLIRLKTRTPLVGIDLSPPTDGTPNDPSENRPAAYLVGVDLTGAILAYANLSGAFLGGADLSDTNLRDADLSGAVLSGAALTGAFLNNADLSGAILREADLFGAILRDADLSGADLSGADFAEVRGLEQAQLDRAWAWADEPPQGLEKRTEPLALPRHRLCDPALREAWFEKFAQTLKKQQHYGPPAGCAAADPGP